MVPYLHLDILVVLLWWEPLFFSTSESRMCMGMIMTYSRRFIEHISFFQVSDSKSSFTESIGMKELDMITAEIETLKK